MEDKNFLSEIVEELNSAKPNLQNVNQGEDIIQNDAQPEQKPVVAEQQTKNEPEAASVENQTIENQSVEEKPWWDAEEKVVEAKAEKEVVQNKKEEYIEEDPDIELIRNYKKSGKSLTDFVKEYTVQDFSQMGEAEIVKKGLEEFYNLSGEELNNAVYEFENSSIFQKKQLVEGFTNRFNQMNDAKLKELTSNYKMSEEENQKAVEQLGYAMEDYRQKIVNNEFYGMKVTDEMSQDLTKYLKNEFTLQREDGTLDIEKAYSVALWLKYGKELVKANVTKAKNLGKEQVIKEVSNPSKNNTFGGRSVGSGLEAAQEAFNQLFELK